MDLNAQKDHFSRAVVSAIAATAGVGADVPSHDQDSADVHFRGPDTDVPGGQLEAQLKCTQNLSPNGDNFRFPLPVKNYNDLRWPSDQLFVQRILVVVHVPPDPGDWLSVAEDDITLKRRAYWASLAGSPETTNTETVTVDIPMAQVFDPDALLEHLKAPQ